MKTDKELLEQDLCPRLMYGVKVQTKKRIATEQGKPMAKAIGTVIGFSQRTEFEIVFSEGDFAEDFDTSEILPVYHGMEYLTKPITHKGETFVPIEKLMEVMWPKMQIRFEVGNNFVMGVAGDEDDTETWLWFEEWFSFPYWVIEWLTEHHFNLRNLPAHLWVDVNTLPENPYAK